MPKGGPANLVMITLDCVRPDHLGCYGYRGTSTPNLDRLAMEGIVFEQAVSHAPNTWVSHASIFTGCNPPAHGLRGPYNKLSDARPLIAEILQREGYATAGFPGNSLVGKRLGFERGFQYFDEDHFEKIMQVKDIVWRDDWNGTLRRAKGWMKEAGSPFFIWLHYIDTHHLPRLDLPDYYRIQFSDRWQFYDGKISYADQACIGEILSVLEELRLKENTLVVVLADHGEELRNSNIPLHDYHLKDSIMRIPLILWRAGGFGSHRRIPEQVRGIDIMPTIFELLGIGSQRSLTEQIDGWSLESLIKGPCLRPDHTSYAYMENMPKGFRGIRTEEWKLIIRGPEEMVPGGECGQEWKNRKGGKESVELYHIPSDPEEEHDISYHRPTVVEHLMEHLERLEKTHVPQSGGPEELDEPDRIHIEKALKGLGYIDL